MFTPGQILQSQFTANFKTCALRNEEMKNQQVTEDLKAFERRLTEYVSCLGPQTGKWRLILVISSLATAAGAWGLVTDNQQYPSLLQYLFHHKLFTVSCCNLFILFMLGIHRRVMAPQIILARTRIVLEDYNMSCDDKGRLILRPRPT